MEKINMEVDDFLSYCDYKGLSTKAIKSSGEQIDVNIDRVMPIIKTDG